MIYKIKKCIVCEREFKERTKKVHTRSTCNGARRPNGVTCCKLCSSIYQRVYHKIRAIEKQRRKNENSK